jgi:hypothetical protein
VRCVLRSGCSWPNIVFGRLFGHCSRFMTDDAFGGSVSVRGSTSRSAVRSVYRFKFTTYHVIWRFGSSALRPRFENEFMSGDSLGVFGHRGSSSSLARTVHARRFGHRGSGSCSRFKFRFRPSDLNLNLNLEHEPEPHVRRFGHRGSGSCSGFKFRFGSFEFGHRGSGSCSGFKFRFGSFEFGHRGSGSCSGFKFRFGSFIFEFGHRGSGSCSGFKFSFGSFIFGVRSSRFRFVFRVQVQVRVVHLRSSVIEVQVRVRGPNSGSGRSSSEFGHRGSGSCSGFGHRCSSSRRTSHSALRPVFEVQDDDGRCARASVGVDDTKRRASSFKFACKFDRLRPRRSPAPGRVQMLLRAAGAADHSVIDRNRFRGRSGRDSRSR